MTLAIGTVETQVVATPADAPATGAPRAAAAEPDPDKLRLAMRREAQRCQRLWSD